MNTLRHTRDYLQQASHTIGEVLHDSAYTLRQALRDIPGVGQKGAWRLALVRKQKRR
jgi:hypothetical protein